jgi:long-chain fatty acid transport protein
MRSAESAVVGASLALAGIAVLLPGAAAGSGFQLQEQSASGLGIAYAGMAASTQDASTAFWNPAGISQQLTNPEIAAASLYIDPTTRFHASAGSSAPDGGDGGVSSLVPSLYGRAPVRSNVGVGLAINAPFGLSTDWSAPWAGMYRALVSKSETLNINPVVGMRLGPYFSIGAGVSYERLKAKLTNAVTPLVPGSVARLDGSDWAWGWNVGVLADLPAGTRVGLTYRSHTDYNIDGTLRFNSAALSPLASHASTNLRLPPTASFAISQRLLPNLRLLADYTWTGWDTVQSLTVLATDGVQTGQVVSDTALKFSDSWRAGLGLEYQINTPWLLRTGVAYDRSPVQDAFRTPRLPDADRKWLAFGARWKANSRLSLDLGGAYIWVKSAPSELASVLPVPGELIGTYRSHIVVLGSQLNYQF